MFDPLPVRSAIINPAVERGLPPSQRRLPFRDDRHVLGSVGELPYARFYARSLKRFHRYCPKYSPHIDEMRAACRVNVFR